MKFIDDLYKTKQADGTYKWDMTNPAWPATAVFASIFSGIGAGIFMMLVHPASFNMAEWLGGLAGLAGGGGIGVMFHSRANL